MREIRFHGRGGQGVVTSAEILAMAAFKDGKYSQAFPFFGTERRGAPVVAFTRIDDKFINLRTHVYEPDYLIILDDSLLLAVDVTKGLKRDGIIVINSAEKTKSDFRIFSIDATKIALDILGKPIVNTAMLGVFSKATGLVSIGSIEKVLQKEFPPKLAGLNRKLVRKAYKSTRT